MLTRSSRLARTVNKEDTTYRAHATSHAHVDDYGDRLPKSPGLAARHSSQHEHGTPRNSFNVPLKVDTSDDNIHNVDILHSPPFALAPFSLSDVASASNQTHKYIPRGFSLTPHSSAALLVDGVDTTPSSQADAAFDMSQLVSFPEDCCSTQKDALDTAAQPYSTLMPDNSAQISLQAAHLNALRLNDTLESPLEADFEFDSPTLESPNGYHSSPWDTSLVAPSSHDDSLDYPSLFPSSSTAPFGAGSLFAAFPDLALGTKEDRAHDVAQVVAEPIKPNDEADVEAVAAVSPTRDVEVKTEEMDDGDEEYIPSRSTRSRSASVSSLPDRQSSSSVKSHSKKRKSSSPRSTSTSDHAPRDPHTGKRIFNGVRAPAVAARIPVVPHDAPIQPRHYRVESRTSRKVLPKAIAKTIPAQRRRNLSVKLEEDEELDEGEEVRLDNETRRYVDEKRAQNTLAARKSRERKAAYLSGLEKEVEQLRVENELLKARLSEAGMEVDS